MIPKDVVRFECLLYASLVLDALSAALFCAASDGANEATYAFLSLLAAVLIAAATLLVWLAARQRKDWARWALFAFFALTLVTYVGSLGDITFGFKTLIELVSAILSVLAFYFSFTTEARQWFR